MTHALARPTSSLMVANVICMASMLIWSTGIPAADHLIPLLGADQLAAARMGFAAAAVLLFWLLREGFGPMLQVNWLKGIAIGSLIGLAGWFLILGQARGGAITAAVVSASMPVVGIALEVVFDKRRLTAAVILGLVLSVLGAAMMLDPSGKAGSGLTMLIGVGLCFASVLTFTTGSRLTVTAFPDLSPIGRTGVTLTGAAVAMSTAAGLQWFMGGAAPELSNWGWPELGTLLLYSVGALGVSQVLWIMSVERLGIGLSALHINAAPFYVMLILFALGSAWNWWQAFAAAIVAIGVLIAQGLVPLPSFFRR
ncbi:DMT family transporter [Xinfangfangia sp. CPCC 101601]|uniref:DMT family transporter n=1 Tax=Pseudogemmobacter lacusdianii TaxID=3069608 RepID=A0ABU0W3Q8_9RHOB|nr:DMT family transporter [Xinfangfangia sp. CPCC 101601]MDQ2068095.1 DMT family transporter [Xinfangfangia sp. CPCC 101601]